MIRLAARMNPEMRVIEELDSQPQTGLTFGMADFLRRLHATQATFSANDAVIATFVRRDPLAAALSTAAQLARRLDVSKAAVVRFAVRLGYRGFTELREDLRERVMHEQAQLPAMLPDDRLDDVRIFLSPNLTIHPP